MSERPRRRIDVEWVELDGEAVIHDPRTGTLHQLNESAASVWAACDGSADVDEIAAAMQERYGGADDAIARDVRGSLTQLRQSGLLEEAADQSRGDSPAD